jgi:hypothetical protein
MESLIDYRGISIRLTEERRKHILDHPEMAELEPAISETVREPEYVIQSLSDKQARLYYRNYSDTPVGAKLLCVVVKTGVADAFILLD